MAEDGVDPRHYLWVAFGLASVVAPFFVAAEYVPFAIFMGWLGGILGVASLVAIMRGT